MTDADIVIRAAKLLNCKVQGPKIPRNGKPLYTTCLTGSSAIGWMLTLFTQLGYRRRQQIKDCINKWPARKVGAQLGHIYHEKEKTKTASLMLQVLRGTSN